MYSKYLPPKTYTKSISLRLSRESTVCLSSPIPTQAASKKARGLGRRTLQFSENRADSVDEHLAAGMRRADR